MPRFLGSPVHFGEGYIAAIEFNEISDPTEFYWSMWKLRSVLEVLKKC